MCRIQMSKDERISLAYPKLPRGRARRLVTLLASMNSASTAFIAQSQAIGNVSDAAASANIVLKEYGLEIINYPPKEPMFNRFDERTAMHRWQLVDLWGNANDN